MIIVVGSVHSAVRGELSIPGVSTISGDLTCTATYADAEGGFFAGDSSTVPPVPAGITDVGEMVGELVAQTSDPCPCLDGVPGFAEILAAPVGCLTDTGDTTDPSYIELTADAIIFAARFPNACGFQEGEFLFPLADEEAQACLDALVGVAVENNLPCGSGS